MVKIIQEKNLTKIGREPVVIFPLKKWKEIEEAFEDLEDTLKFNSVYQESRDQKVITLKELKKKYNLK